MNAFEVKVMLQRAVNAPIDKLAMTEISKLGKALTQALAKLDHLRAQDEFNSILKGILPEDRRLFDALKKASERLNKDKILATRAARDKCEAISRELRPVLAKIRAADPSSALAIIEKLPKDEVEFLSLMANVSDSNGKFLKFTPKNRAAWLEGVGVKVSGFEFEKRKKSK